MPVRRKPHPPDKSEPAQLAWPADKIERRAVASLVPYAQRPDAL